MFGMVYGLGLSTLNKFSDSLCQLKFSNQDEVESPEQAQVAELARSLWVIQTPPFPSWNGINIYCIEMSCTQFRTIKSRVHHHLMSLPEPLGGPSVLCLQVRVVPPWAPCKASTPDAGWPGNPVVAHDGFDHQHWGKNMGRTA
jgi:hypothetical protein